MCLRGFLATARDFRRLWKCERGWETAGFVSTETVETQVRLTHISCQWNLLLGTQMSAFSSVSIGWNSFSWLADCILKQDNWILIPDVKHLAMTYYNRPKKKPSQRKAEVKNCTINNNQMKTNSLVSVFDGADRRSETGLQTTSHRAITSERHG